MIPIWWLMLLVLSMRGHLVVGPTYAAAEWDCGKDWECYVVVSWADGPDKLLMDYDL